MKGRAAQQTKFPSFRFIDPLFIPFACHYNDGTIITKNGELLSVIKISSFASHEVHEDAEKSDLRGYLRSAILNNIKSQEYAFWIHTIRRVFNLSSWNDHDNQLLHAVHDNWSRGNNFEHQHISELYLTVLIEGRSVGAKNIQEMFKYLDGKKLVGEFESFFLEQNAKLHDTCTKIIYDLEEYSAKKLTIVDRKGVLYSEPCEFFSKIFNLTDTEIPLNYADISNTINQSRFALHQSRIDISNHESESSVATLTIKQYLETSINALDEVLQLPIEFIIYQVFDYVNFDEVKDKYEKQHKMLLASKDTFLLEKLGFESNIKTKVSKIEYGESQICIILIGKTPDELETNVRIVADRLSKIGLIAVRDDILLENSLYGSLPGNFSLLKRMQPLKTSKIAGFASIDNYPAGKIFGNKWGNALAIMRTKDDSPYFFNFHDDTNNGNTIIFGDHNYYRNAIVNFLLLQSVKYETRIISLDYGASSQSLIAMLGGTYLKVSIKPESGIALFNPFALLDKQSASDQITSEVDIKFIRQFCIKLFKISNLSESEYFSDLEIITKIISQNKHAIKRLSDLLNIVQNEHLKESIQMFCEGGPFGHLFDAETDMLLYENQYVSIDIADILHHNVFGLFFEYFYYYINRGITPKTIVKIEEAFSCFDSADFSKTRIANWSKFITNHDGVLILTTSDHTNGSFFSSLDEINNSFRTIVTAHSQNFSDQSLRQVFKKSFQFSDRQYDHMQHFLARAPLQHLTVKHSKKVVHLDLDFECLIDILPVLSGQKLQKDKLEYLQNRRISLQDKLSILKQ